MGDPNSSNGTSIQKRIKEVEAQMQQPDFWHDKEKAQQTIAEYNELKDRAAGKDKFDRGNATLTLLAGAGGLDAEDFARILLDMYVKYIEQKGWKVRTLHENRNDHDGIRNITIEVSGAGVYGALKHEAGVHRLVRISPFNARKQRHTSFAMVDVVPVFKQSQGAVIRDEDIEITFTKSSGPGGQNVNKRETAVRITHTPSKVTVHVDGERTQERNREKALEILRGKLYKIEEEKRQKEREGHSVAATTSVEWGNQIRSYVFHPYQMVKDHRTNVEVRNVDAVLDGDIEAFITGMQTLS